MSLLLQAPVHVHCLFKFALVIGVYCNWCLLQFTRRNCEFKEQNINTQNLSAVFCTEGGTSWPTFRLSRLFHNTWHVTLLLTSQFGTDHNVWATEVLIRPIPFQAVFSLHEDKFCLWFRGMAFFFDATSTATARATAHQPAEGCVSPHPHTLLLQWVMSQQWQQGHCALDDREWQLVGCGVSGRLKDCWSGWGTGWLHG
jgi:hypothetical protein